MDTATFSLTKYAALARRAAAEGCVLLKNEGGALPLRFGECLAIFGRTQLNDYKSGLGSGGLVNTRSSVGLVQALREDGRFTLDEELHSAYREWEKEHPYQDGGTWTQHPWFQEEMPVTEAQVSDAAQRTDTALLILGRTAGEDRDNCEERGSYLLTEAEERLLMLVRRFFKRMIVLLNVGNRIDMRPIEAANPDAVLFTWQGGQEGGHGVVDVLSGDVNPCGRLTDSVACTLADDPAAANFGGAERNCYCEDIYVGYRYYETFAKDRVLYPFGYGLSYTSFRHEAVGFAWREDHAKITCRVTNTGEASGCEVVQVYCAAPQGALGKPARVLCGYARTALLVPGDTAEITVAVPSEAIASYDDSGASGHPFCWVLEKGEYRFFAGHDVRQAELAGQMTLPETVVIREAAEVCAPDVPMRRMRPGRDGQPAWEDVPLRTHRPAERRLAQLPPEIAQTGDCGIRLADVGIGKAAMDAFIAQLTDDDLCCLVRGEGMCSPKATPGTAGAFGGVTPSLAALGLPVACCADGPSGIRMDCGNFAFLLPCGTCLACTWDDALVQTLYTCTGLELRMNQIDLLLGPGMNIHRHPLLGRSFEYFSEDPFLTGRMACAVAAGLKCGGVSGVVKHFAANNQETGRTVVSSTMSERALREIYLRGFEAAIRTGHVDAVMTGYNPLNGVWTSSHFGLVTSILREEWGFDGIVMTDWWAKGGGDGEADDVRNVSAMIRAQNDLFMVCDDAASNSGDDDLMEALHTGRLTRGELQRSAANICRYLLKTPAMRRLTGTETELDRQLRARREDEGCGVLTLPALHMNADNALHIPGKDIVIRGGSTSQWQLLLNRRGVYAVTLTLRAAEGVSPLQQLNVSVFCDRGLLGIVSLRGSDQEWCSVRMTMERPTRRKTFYLKLFFASGGLEVRECLVTEAL